MIPSEYTKLIDLVSAKTDSKELSWATTSADNKFIAKIGTRAVSISKYEYNSTFGLDYPDRWACSFEILDHYAEKIDGIYLDQDEAGYSDLEHIYDAARRSALRIDQTITELLRDLGDNV